METIERVKRVNIPVDTMERVERLNVPVERVERVVDRAVRYDGGAYEGSRGGYDYGGEDRTNSGFDAGVRFERHDRNGDGYLNRHEFRGLMREWEAEQPDLGLWHSWRRTYSTFDELDRLFDRYDDNRDQHLSRVSPIPVPAPVLSNLPSADLSNSQVSPAAATVHSRSFYSWCKTWPTGVPLPRTHLSGRSYL